MKKDILLTVISLLFISVNLTAQVSINADGNQPDPSAMLDVYSTTKGALAPRMTKLQRDLIANPAEGLIVFCTDCTAEGTPAITVFYSGIWHNMLSCITPAAPLSGIHVPDVTSILWKWNPVSGATIYKWNTINNYMTAMDVGGSLYAEYGLNCNSIYTRYVWAVNECGYSNVTTLSQATLPDPPDTPDQADNIPSITQIIWNWTTIDGAIGYKWNTENDYNSAVDMGILTTKTEEWLTSNTSYTRFVWAYNACGNSTTTMLTAQTLPFMIGASYGGGIIFYIDGTGQHGLISATSDLNPSQWGCNGTFISGTSASIGAGQANTTAIVNSCNEAGIAARNCDDLDLNGYSDWFLPSKDELSQLYSKKNVVGGFTDNCYWSSCQYDNTAAWVMCFPVGFQSHAVKNTTRSVRAIRAF